MDISGILSTALNNPVTRSAWSVIAVPFNKISKSSPKEVALELIMPSTKKWVRIAGVCGAAAIMMGAYGAHVVLLNKELPSKVKETYETASKYHMYHSIALLGVPFARYPNITGLLFINGMVLFSGSCYWYALHQTDAVRKFTPWGGMLLIAGWLSFIL